MTVPTVERGLRDCALLVDRDGRAQPVDLVDVRLLHLAQELARVRAQALDVPALALGVDRVEREAALAAAAQARDDDQAVPRERDVDVLEVVLARAAHDDLILGHAAQFTRVPGLVQVFYLRAPGALPRGTHLRGLLMPPLVVDAPARAVDSESALLSSGTADPGHCRSPDRSLGTDRGRLAALPGLRGVSDW